MTVRFGLHNDQPVAIAETQLQIQDESGSTRLIYRELNPPPTPADFQRLRSYQPRTRTQHDWTDQNPHPDLTNSYTITTRVDPHGRLPFTIDGTQPYVGTASAARR